MPCPWARARLAGLTCDPADPLLGEEAGDPSHVGPQAVAEDMDLLPGVLQLGLRWVTVF